MINFKWTGAVLAIFTALLKLQAQNAANSDSTSANTEPLVMSTSDLATVQTLSTAELAAFLIALDATPQIAYTNIGEQADTFYSLQNPDWPPLPGDVNGLPVWPMNGFYLLNDVAFNYAAAAAQFRRTSMTASAATMAADDLPSPGDGGINTYTPNNLPAPNYGTNLWLAQVALANGSLTAIASNTLPDVYYEVQTNADLTTTNWGAFAAYPYFYGSETTNWTPLNAILIDPGVTNLFFRLRSWGSSDGSGLPDWWELEYGVTDPYADPMGDGWSNLQKYQNGMNPNLFYTPPTPQGLTVNLHQASQTAGINWLPSPGQVTGYSIEKTDTFTIPATVQTNNVLSGVTSYTDDISGNSLNPWYGNSYDVSYRVRANYANGSSSPWSASMPLQPVNVSGVIIPGVGGTATLTVAGLPANAVTVRLYFADESDGAQNNNDTSFNYSEDVPVASLVNGSYQMPAAWQPPTTDAYGPANYTVFLKAVDASGNEGGVTLVYLSDGNWNQPFYDARAQLKQNLIFQLRAAPVDAPLTFAIPATNNYDFGSFGTSVGDYDYPASYAYAGLYQFANSIGDYYESFDALLPFKENNLFRNFVFSSADADTNGILTTGVFAGYKDGYFEYNAFVNLCRPLTYRFQAGQTNGPALLPADQTRWLFYDPPVDNDDVLLIGLISQDSFSISMTNNYRNWFGLPYVSALAAMPSDPPGTLLTSLIKAGQTVAFPTNADPRYYNYYPETAQPQFQAVEYDFFNTAWIWNETLQKVVPPPPLPGDLAFATTNQSQILFATPGNSIQIVGYAKLAVTNGYPGVYAYLGQYFDKAYRVADNGSVTTNQTGMLSPYGDFFATEPGDAALVTLPDLDTGERGTGMVHCVSAVIDRSQGSNMDLSFNGANATSANDPAIIWCNNNYDRGHVVDGNDFEQDDLSQADIANLNVPPEQKVPDCQYQTNGLPAIPCTRDLEDYFRLWLPGVNAAMQAMPTNYTVKLTLTGDAQIRIFQAVETDGGTNYLFDETTASNQVANSASLYVGLLTASSPIAFNITTNFNEHFIFCGTQTGSAQIDLQVLDGNSNLLADATTYLQVKDIKQMYERWTVGDNPNVAPMAAPVSAVDGLAAFATPFQYSQSADTNTPYILFVHGWNMEAWEKDRYAEAAYKRLYWQGYKGRFGSFRWPTGNKFSGIISAIIDGRNYDNSEYQAWQSATGLTNLLTQLNAESPGNVYLMAHSMGNVVAGEAMRKASGQLVNTYIAMQGAIPAHCYDAATMNRTTFSVPDRYAFYYTDSSPSYFSSSAGAGTYVNFYNTNDYALGWWNVDQNNKPDIATSPGYHYSSSSGFYKILGAQTNSTTYLSFPEDTYEIFAYADPAWSYALGAQADVGGSFQLLGVPQQVNLPSIWPADNHPNRLLKNG